MKIKLTNQESEQYFQNALCNGLGYFFGYGLTLDYLDEDYDEAKKNLSSPCYEDVLLEILRIGKTLTMVDEEGEGENNSTITLKDVHERVCLVPIRHLMDMVNENDDADTADAIMQQVFFNEITFG